MLAILCLVEDVVVASHVACLEIENQSGVNSFAHDTGFEMEVASEGASRVACQSDGVASFHFAVDAGEVLGEVAVDSFEAVMVADHYKITITTAFISHHAYFSAEGCANGVARIGFDVNTFVHSAEAGAVAEIAGYNTMVDRHCKISQVDFEVLGYSGFRVAVGVLGVPIRIEPIAIVSAFSFFNLKVLQRDRIYGFQLAVNRSLTGQQVLSVGGNCQSAQEEGC